MYYFTFKDQMSDLVSTDVFFHKLLWKIKILKIFLMSSFSLKIFKMQYLQKDFF